jgi:hypothetical protein
MRFGLPPFVALSLGFSLLGCRQPLQLAPVGSGSIITQGAMGLRILTPAQVKALLAWFASNSGGWRPSADSYVSSDQFRLTHQDGRITEVDVFMDGLVVVNTISGRFVRRFSATEVSKLLAIARYQR